MRFDFQLLVGLLSLLVFCSGARADIVANGNSEFSGKQGNLGWYYGYYERSVDLAGGGDGIYDDSKFTQFKGGDHLGPNDPGNDWSTTFWDLAGGAPFTEITDQAMVPNNFRGVQQFAVMRWVSDEQGVASVTGFFERYEKSQPDGTIGRVFRNGEQLFAQKTLEAAAPFDLMINDLKVGDILDFAVDYGTDFGGNSSLDQTAYSMVVDLISEGLLGDFNFSGVLDLPDIDILTMQSASGANDPTYNLNDDALVNGADVKVWVRDLYNSWIGDADLDGEFKSEDLIQVLAASTYENQDLEAVWSTGDFNGSGRFTSEDLIDALGDGGYEMGPRAAVSMVPEPNSLLLLLLGCLPLLRRRRFA